MPIGYSLSEIVSLAANSKAFIGGAGGLAILSTVGVIPRVGLGRGDLTRLDELLQDDEPFVCEEARDPVVDRIDYIYGERNLYYFNRRQRVREVLPNL